MLSFSIFCFLRFYAFLLSSPLHIAIIVMSAFGTRYEDQHHLDPLLTRQRQDTSAFSDFLLPFPDSDPNIAASASNGLEQQYSSFISPPASGRDLSTVGAYSTTEESGTGYIPERASHSWNMSSNGYPDFLGQYDDRTRGSSAYHDHETDFGRYTTFNSLGQLAGVPSTQGEHTANQTLWSAPTLISLDPEEDNWVECSEALVKSSNRAGHVYRVQGWSPPEAQRIDLAGQINTKQTQSSTAGPSHNRTDSVEIKREPGSKPSHTKWARRGAVSSGGSRRKREGPPTSSAPSQIAGAPIRSEEVSSKDPFRFYD